MGTYLEKSRLKMAETYIGHPEVYRKRERRAAWFLVLTTTAAFAVAATAAFMQSPLWVVAAVPIALFLRVMLRDLMDTNRADLVVAGEAMLLLVVGMMTTNELKATTQFSYTDETNLKRRKFQLILPYDVPGQPLQKLLPLFAVNIYELLQELAEQGDPEHTDPELRHVDSAKESLYLHRITAQHNQFTLHLEAGQK